MKKEELVGLVEYAKLHGLTRDTVRQRCKRGAYKTARKIGSQWVIDKNEPHIDNRIKSGNYKNFRKKYGKNKIENN